MKHHFTAEDAGKYRIKKQELSFAKARSSQRKLNKAE